MIWDEVEKGFIATDWEIADYSFAALIGNARESRILAYGGQRKTATHV